jgi:hypothetical protein
MKSFKKYITEEPVDLEQEDFYVIVKSGKAVLCSTKSATPCSSFGWDVVNAIIQGDSVITTSKDGKTQVWKLQRTGRTVIGPIQTR